MAYTRGKSPQPQATVMNIEQARRLNAELRREHAALTLENTALQGQVSALRGEVTAARKTLARKVRDLDAVRAQIDQLALVKPSAPVFDPPKYGGREGLEAATRELEEHEPKGGVNPKRRNSRGASHGTRGKYDQGCNCEPCLGWRRRASEKERVAQQVRKSRLNSQGEKRAA